MISQAVQMRMFGVGLLPIDTPALVSRYNQCLEHLGIDPTPLHFFHVDGMGWSPEIATERQDPYYLSAGVANPMAIVLSPDQRFKPILFPYSSYDRALMNAYFEQFANEIADITSSAYIGLDIDQGLSRYQNPRDLLLVEYIIVRSHAGELTAAALHQRRLVDRFNSNGLEWFEPKLRDEIIQSAKFHGDLRFRRVYIPDMRFADIQSFYTRAFEGVFVLRDPAKHSNILVIEKSEKLPAFKNGTQDTFAITDPKLLGRLFRENWVEVNLRWYKQNLNALEQKRECVLAHILCSEDPALDYLALSSAQKKRKMANLGAGTLPEVIDELERLIKQLEQNSIPSRYDLSPELQMLLLRPDPHLSESEQALAWQLITRLQPLDVYQLYRADRNRFLEQYNTWPESKKAWAKHMIMEQDCSVTENDYSEGART